MSMRRPFVVVWTAKGGHVLLGRLTAEDGTGSQSPIEEEGNLMKAQDVDEVRVEVYNIVVVDGVDVATVTHTSIPLPSSVITTVLKNTGIWKRLPLGGNFRCELPETAFPNPGRYRAEVKVVSNGGEVGWGLWDGPSVVPVGT